MNIRRRGRASRARAGGVPARRAIARWGWRLLRREWRQQVLVLTLLTLAVMAAVGGASAAYQLGPLGHTARFGAANQMFKFDGAEPDVVDAAVAKIEDLYGTIDVIGRRQVVVPGTADIAEVRAQDPQGAHGGPMLELVEGRYPTGTSDVAVTDGVARSFDVAVGSRFTLDGRERRVVGLVENPADLRDEFALVAPRRADPPQTTIVLVNSAQPPDVPALPEGGFDWEMAGQMPDEQQVQAALVALAAAAVAMVLVCLVAAAGFVVVAQRRQRQLAMLAAIGATRKQLRGVMVTNGAAVGVTAAVIGTALAFVVWLVAAPSLETVVQARVDRFGLLPWWLIAIAMLLAVVAATAAAWWPARAVVRLPVALALSGRPSPPRPARQSAALAGGLVMVGVVCLVAADRTNALLVGTGTVAMVVGLLLVSPLAVRVMATAAVRLPVAVRLAVRDLARYQTRAAAALAATSLTLGIAAMVIITVTAVERSSDIGNLSSSQMLITVERSRIRELVTDRTPAEIEAFRAQVNRLVAPLDDPAVVTLQMAVDPQEEPNPGRGVTWRHAVEVGDGPQTANPGPLFVATPQILSLHGIDADEIARDTEVLTVRTGDIGLRFGITEEVVANVERLDAPAYASAPTSLITRDALRRRGWEPAFVGWFVDAGEPLTSGQIAEAQRVAASAGLMVMTRDGVNLADLGRVRTSAMLAGMVVALAVLAMTAGLIRSEAVGDLRTLTATGATRRIRRTLTAATTGTLALLGAVLGTAGAYLTIAAGFVDGLDSLAPVPVVHLLIVVVGVPLVATTAGWLLGGRQPSTLAARQAIE